VRKRKYTIHYRPVYSAGRLDHVIASEHEPMKRRVVTVSQKSIRWMAEVLPVDLSMGDTLVGGDWDLQSEVDADEPDSAGRFLLPVAIGRTVASSPAGCRDILRWGSGPGLGSGATPVVAKFQN
jgi:hypothetical protein